MGAFDTPKDGKGAMTISHSGLAKLFKAYPQLEADLAAAVIEKTTYRFGAKKPGADDSEDDE
jgi:hypothetical protein